MIWKNRRTGQPFIIDANAKKRFFEPVVDNQGWVKVPVLSCDKDSVVTVQRYPAPGEIVNTLNDPSFVNSVAELPKNFLDDYIGAEDQSGLFTGTPVMPRDEASWFLYTFSQQLVYGRPISIKAFDVFREKHREVVQVDRFLNAIGIQSKLETFMAGVTVIQMVESGVVLAIAPSKYVAAASTSGSPYMPASGSVNIWPGPPLGLWDKRGDETKQAQIAMTHAYNKDRLLKAIYSRWNIKPWEERENATSY